LVGCFLVIKRFYVYGKGEMQTLGNFRHENTCLQSHRSVRTISNKLRYGIKVIIGYDIQIRVWFVDPQNLSLPRVKRLGPVIEIGYLICLKF
jgi:hypothetical protein